MNQHKNGERRHDRFGEAASMPQNGANGQQTRKYNSPVRVKKSSQSNYLGIYSRPKCKSSHAFIRP